MTLQSQRAGRLALLIDFRLVHSPPGNVGEMDGAELGPPFQLDCGAEEGEDG